MFRGENGPDLPEWADEWIDFYDIIEFSGWDLPTVRATRVIERDRLLTIYRAKRRAQVSMNER